MYPWTPQCRPDRFNKLLLASSMESCAPGQPGGSQNLPERLQMWQTWCLAREMHGLAVCMVSAVLSLARGPATQQQLHVMHTSTMLVSLRLHRRGLLSLPHHVSSCTPISYGAAPYKHVVWMPLPRVHTLTCGTFHRCEGPDHAHIRYTQAGQK